MKQSWKKSSVLDWYSASDHLYLLHEFAGNRNRSACGKLKDLTKKMDINKSLNTFDEYLDAMENGEMVHGVQFQKCLERMFAVEWKKTFPPWGKQNFSYWWNEELSVLRGTILNVRRRAQRAVAASRNNTGHWVTTFKEATRRLKRAIERSKEKMWKEFCGTLDQDPWGRPYRAIRVKMVRKIPPVGLRKGKVDKILEDLFVTSLVKQAGDARRPDIPQMHEAKTYDLRITEDDLLTAMEKCDPRKRDEKARKCGWGPW
jgi:hypothetical protein